MFITKTKTNKQKKPGRDCLASIKPWVQTPVPPNIAIINLIDNHWVPGTEHGTLHALDQMVLVLVRLLSLWQITERISLKEDLFSLMASEISAHGQLALLFLGHGLAEYQGGKHVLEQSSLFHGRQEAERRGRSQKQGVLQRHAPLTYFLWPGPTFHSSTIFQESVQILTPSMA
jgi:hypothetical protein